MAPRVPTRNVTAVLIAAALLLKLIPTKPVAHTLKPKYSMAQRDTAHVLKVSRNTVSNQFKKKTQIVQVNPAYAHQGLTLSLKVDESWSFVGSKQCPRWLWWVENASNGQIVAFVFGRRTHATFRNLVSLLDRHGIKVGGWIRDAWWAYIDCLDQKLRVESKALLQSLERKHLTLRTRIKRLTRRTIYFSKSITVHDNVIGLFINRFFFEHQHS